MNLHELVQQTVQALGLELVEIDRSAGGLLRIFIDTPPKAGNAEADIHVDTGAVTIEDCEKVSRQLQYALQVQDVDYQRLEVSSPGIDRLLRNEQDFERYAGQAVDLTLKQPVGANSCQLAANRKNSVAHWKKPSQAGKSSGRMRRRQNLASASAKSG